MAGYWRETRSLKTKATTTVTWTVLKRFKVKVIQVLSHHCGVTLNFLLKLKM
jgi:hypothetical protein